MAKLCVNCFSQTVSIIFRTMCYGSYICKYENDVSRVEQFLYRIIQAYPAQICASYTVSVIQTIVSYCFESPLTLCDFLLLCCR